LDRNGYSNVHWTFTEFAEDGDCHGYDDNDHDDDKEHDDDQVMAMMMMMAMMTTALTTTALTTFSGPHVCVLCGWARSGRLCSPLLLRRACGSSAKEAN
jgi:hypothetical protein